MKMPTSRESLVMKTWYNKWILVWCLWFRAVTNKVRFLLFIDLLDIKSLKNICKCSFLYIFSIKVYFYCPDKNFCFSQIFFAKRRTKTSVHLNLFVEKSCPIKSFFSPFLEIIKWIHNITYTFATELSCVCSVNNLYNNLP